MYIFGGKLNPSTGVCGASLGMPQIRYIFGGKLNPSTRVCGASLEMLQIVYKLNQGGCGVG